MSADAPRLERLGRARRSPSSVLMAALVGVLGLAFVVRSAVTVWTEQLWFSDLGFGPTWSRMLSAKLTLGLAATALVFAVASVSLLIAERFAPDDAVFSHRDPLIVVRAFTALHPNLTRNVLAGFCALVFGPIAGGAWNEWTLFRYGRDAARPSFALFGRSLGFYMFRLPFLRSVCAWGFATLLVITLVTVAVLYLNGAVRFDESGSVVSLAARRHVSVLLAALLLVRGAGFWYARFALTFSRHEHFDGANFVDLKVRAPAYLAMTMISVIGAVLLLANLGRATWQIPAGVVLAWLLLVLVTLAIVPLAWQRVTASSELTRETSSIQRNIAATRSAFELDRVTTTELAADNGLTGADDELQASAQSLRNVRLWDTNSSVAAAAFNNIQKVFQNFQISNVDADRTRTGDTVTPRLIAVREIDPAGQPSSWVNRRLTFTHGYGVVTASATEAVDGDPRFIARDLPPVGTPKLTQPRIYFGEETDGYVVVGSKNREIDFGGTVNRAAPPYAGKGGIKIGSLPRRLAFAMRLGDLNLVLSNNLDDRSRMLWTRNIRERAQRLAPFLRFDSDPLPVVHGGRIVWVIEGYTISTSFPNSDRSKSVSSRHGLPETVSYARNSVRVVIDAYTGATSFFRIPGVEDAIIDAYDRAFPSMFSAQSLDERYPGLSDAVRYPRDLFDLRASLWGRFHTQDAQSFYSATDRWIVGTSGAGIRKEESASATLGVTQVVRRTPTPVQYVVSDPIGTGQQEFLAQQILVSNQAKPEEQRLRGIVLARSTRREYGRLTVLSPRDESFDSPYSAAAALAATPVISERETALGRGGSEVVSGDVQVVRVGRGLMYVRPLYVQSEKAQKPLLQYVEVRFRGRTGFAPTFAGALAQVAGRAALVPSLDGSSPVAGTSSSGSSGSSGSSSSSGSSPEPVTIAQLLAQAAADYRDAQASLARGDLGGYQAKVDDMGRAIEQANLLAAPASTTATTAAATAAETTAAAPTTSTPTR